MGLKEKIQEDLTGAMKARDEKRSGTLRMVLAAIKNEEVAGKVARQLTDAEIITVLSREAKKRREAAEGFEAGGHNGREETTTMCLIPQVVDAVKIPVIAAGGIGSGRAMLAAFSLGADGVQIGTAFAATAESSAHENFKQKITSMQEGDTELSLKKIVPVRLVKNHFYEMIKAAEDRGASADELKEILGRARAKKGMFEGDLDEGELEIGQIASIIKQIKPAAQVLNEIWNDFVAQHKNISNISL